MTIQRLATSRRAGRRKGEPHSCNCQPEQCQPVSETLGGGNDAGIPAREERIFEGCDRQKLLRRSDGTVERLEGAGGVPLGVMEDALYECAFVDLLPGNELLIITDGITEAMSPSQDQFGDDRVTALVAHRSPREGTLLHQLLAQVVVFEAGGPQSDDIAAILLKLENRVPSAIDGYQ